VEIAGASVLPGGSGLEVDYEDTSPAAGAGVGREDQVRALASRAAGVRVADVGPARELVPVTSSP